MLVMRRRAGESLLIGDEIEIEVLEVSASRVKLGIAAPAPIAIQRKEVKLTGEENHTAARGFEPHDLARLARKLSKDRR